KQEEQVAAASTETASGEGQKASTPRSSRRTKEKEKSKAAPKADLNRMGGLSLLCRCPRQILDVSRPQWSLRFVSDQSEADSVQVSKDTGRADEIKAMKKAWEAVDPGRSLKAQQVRLQFITQFGDTPPAAGRWRMRLIRSCDPPAKLNRDTPLCSFATKEFRDYYIPDDRNIICRFSVKVTRDHVGTVQVQVTEPDIYVKLTVLDCEEEVASATGRALAIVPVFRFLPNEPPKRESAQPPVTRSTPHKYIIQAEVLHKSRSQYEKAVASQEKDWTTGMESAAHSACHMVSWPRLHDSRRG
uniref:Androglobin domain-containing protein n=1 Tax=Paramormyrops kingsleyae TaxID=1676925 RepID=A0A3B3SV17_9TELE